MPSHTFIRREVAALEAQGVPVERSTDLVTRAAYDLDWGEDAPKILSWGIDATEGTPNLRAADAIQVILDMAPYWKQAHQLTGRSVREISLDKAPTVFAIQKVLYQICSNDPSLAKQLLRRFGLSDQLLTAENSYHFRAAGQWAAAEWATLVARCQGGAGDSGLVCGDCAAHHRLEEGLARCEEAEAALLSGSGFAANTDILPAVAGPADVVLSDALNHASLVDGCRLARARVRRLRRSTAEPLGHAGKRIGAAQPLAAEAGAEELLHCRNLRRAAGEENHVDIRRMRTRF